MTTMIERVAQAIADSAGHIGTLDGVAGAVYRAQARAAIAAMRPDIIEECARLVEADFSVTDEHGYIAAAIRALKEKS